MNKCTNMKKNKPQNENYKKPKTSTWQLRNKESITQLFQKNVIKNNIKHEDYKNTLINNEQMHQYEKKTNHKMKTIRSQRHQLGSYETNEVSLSCFDDKRYIHDNGTSSYAYGHYKIK